MKKTLILLTVSAFMTIGCDWLGHQPVVSECDKCRKCVAGCCLKGTCDNADCVCACKRCGTPTE